MPTFLGRCRRRPHAAADTRENLEKSLRKRRRPSHPVQEIPDEDAVRDNDDSLAYLVGFGTREHEWPPALQPLTLQTSMTPTA